MQGQSQQVQNLISLLHKGIDGREKENFLSYTSWSIQNWMKLVILKWTRPTTENWKNWQKRQLPPSNVMPEK